MCSALPGRCRFCKAVKPVGSPGLGESSGYSVILANTCSCWCATLSLPRAAFLLVSAQPWSAGVLIFLPPLRGEWGHPPVLLTLKPSSPSYLSCCLPSTLGWFLCFAVCPSVICPAEMEGNGASQVWGAAQDRGVNGKSTGSQESWVLGTLTLSVSHWTGSRSQPRTPYSLLSDRDGDSIPCDRCWDHRSLFLHLTIVRCFLCGHRRTRLEI